MGGCQSVETKKVSIKESGQYVKKQEKKITVEVGLHEMGEKSNKDKKKWISHRF